MRASGQCFLDAADHGATLSSLPMASELSWLEYACSHLSPLDLPQWESFDRAVRQARRSQAVTDWRAAVQVARTELQAAERRTAPGNGV